ncbi:MAG: gliding motility-associated C-terminal domain-containing protein, partial [Bacteroidota bacterium]
QGESLVLDAGNFPASEYLWSTGDTSRSITVAASGNYSVQISNDCLDLVDDVQITVQDPGNQLLYEQICEGESYALNGQSYTEPGIYEDFVPNAGPNGCGLFLALELFIQPTIERDTQVLICEGEEVLLLGQIYAESGEYEQLVAAGEDDCPIRYFISIENSLGAVELTDLELEPGENSTLTPLINNLSAPLQASWTPSLGLSCTDCLNPTLTGIDSEIYTLVITDANGCTYRATTNVMVSGDIPIYVPNVFSPNGDQQNDYFLPLVNTQIVTAIVDFRIYDRWGAEVYAGQNLPLNGQNSGWDGQFKGRVMDNGVFAYWVQFRLQDGTTIQRAGDVTLVR